MWVLSLLSIAIGGAALESSGDGAMVVYRDGLVGNWYDDGWAPRDVYTDAGARVDFANWGGWTIKGPSTRDTFDHLYFCFAAPAKYQGFLAVQLGGERESFPLVPIEHRHLSRHDDWVEVEVGYDELNPESWAFDAITLKAIRDVPTGWVEVNNIALVSDEETPGTIRPSASSSGVAFAGGMARDGDFAIGTARPNDPVAQIGVAAHVGSFLPASGGSPGVTAGLEIRYTLLDGMLALGAMAFFQHHQLAVARGTGGAVIEASSTVSTVPVLGTLTFRVPLPAFTLFVRGGFGRSWVMATRHALGLETNGTGTMWAGYGAAGAELHLGPGWLGAELGSLLLPKSDLDVVRNHTAGGLTFHLSYRLGS